MCMCELVSLIISLPFGYLYVLVLQSAGEKFPRANVFQGWACMHVCVTYKCVHFHASNMGHLLNVYVAPSGD